MLIMCTLHTADLLQSLLQNVLYGATTVQPILTCIASLQIRDRLQHGLEPVRLLCVKTQHNNVVEIDFAAVSGLISSECIAHEHQQTTSAGVQAPSASYLQQIALSAAVNHGDNADTDDNTPMDHLHELYEWIGGVSCGLQGECSLLQNRSCIMHLLCSEPSKDRHTTSQPYDLCTACDTTGVNNSRSAMQIHEAWHGIAGHDWHSLDEQHMQEVALHKNTWTGLVAPCQVVSTLPTDIYCCSSTSHVALLRNLFVTIDKHAMPLLAYVVGIGRQRVLGIAGAESCEAGAAASP